MISKYIVYITVVFVAGLASCAQLKSTNIVSETKKSVKIPFTISTANNIIFHAVLNDKDTLKLFFDTGGTSIVLKKSAITERTSLLTDSNPDSAGFIYNPYDEINSLTIGELRWEGLAVFPARLGPEEADGHFGWNLFENKVVEIDYENQFIAVSDDLLNSTEGFAKLKIEYTHTLFCIDATISVKGNDYRARYLFDTGFQRAIILDKDLRKKNKFPQDLPVIKESKLKNGAGVEFVNYVVNVDEIKLGTSTAKNVPVQLLSTPNPARFKTHILGGELLKRFNTILDFRHNFVYLKPNSLLGLPYADAS